MVERLAGFWWQVLPRRVARVSRLLSAALSDGLYLRFLSPFGAFAGPLALLLGLVVGWGHFGLTTVFTESRLVLLLAVVLGFLSAQLGFFFTLGFGLGDLLFHDQGLLAAGGFLGGVEVHVALLITYLGLAMLAVGLPLLVRLLRAQTPLPRGDLGLILEVFIAVLGANLLTYLFLNGLPMMIRPLYTWQGGTPPVPAVQILQFGAIPFALVAGAAAAVRVLLDYGAAAGDPVRFQLAARELGSTPPSLLEAAPMPLRLVGQAVFTTLLLAGLFAGWLSALLFAGAVLAIGLGRWLGARALPAWPRLMSRVPLFLRLGLGLGLGYLAASAFLLNRLSGSSFWPLIWALVLALVCLAIFFPEPDAEKRTKAG